MKILFDTNIVLDVLTNRKPWVVDSYKLWQANDNGLVKGYVTASSMTDIYYIIRRLSNHQTALEAVLTCLEAFEIIAVDKVALQQASELSGKDFEDNLQAVCANVAGLDVIVTRDPAGFSDVQISVLSPDNVIQRLT
jgi:predicted nucleic acid-binding protein